MRIRNLSSYVNYFNEFFFWVLLRSPIIILHLHERYLLILAVHECTVAVAASKLSRAYSFALDLLMAVMCRRDTVELLLKTN